MMKSPHYAIDIIKHLYKYGISDKFFLHFLIVISGVLDKLLSLISMVAMLQAVVFVLMPQYALAVFDKIDLYIGLTYGADDILPFSTVLILLVQTLYILSRSLHSKLLAALLHSILQPRPQDNKLLWEIKHDKYMVEFFSKAIIAFDRSLTVIVYSIVLAAIVTYFSISFLWAMLVCFVALVILQVFYGRPDIAYQDTLSASKQKFLAFFNANSKDSCARIVDVNSPERRSYLKAKQLFRDRVDRKKSYSLILGGLVMIVSVMFLANVSDFNNEHIASALILFLFSIRSLVAAGSELSVNLSQIMELRKHLKSISEMAL